MLSSAVAVGLLQAGCTKPPAEASPADFPTSAPVPAAPSNEVARRVKLTAFSPEELDARADVDAQRLKRLAGTANRLAAAVSADAALFERTADAPLSADDRTRALALFADVLDHCHALDAIVRFHLDFWHINPVTESSRHARHFDLGYLAYLEKLALALSLVDSSINKPQFEKLFDEGSPEFGIPAGAYARLKWNVVHIDDVAKSLAAHQYLKVLAGQNATLSEKPDWAFVTARIEERYQDVKTRLSTKSAKLFGGNSLDIGFDLAHAAWFPVQAETAEWLGDTRVRRTQSMLITEAQVEEAVALSQPGDVIVERRNWYLSNIGLPGFWPHAALWLGSPEELKAWSTDKDIEAFYKRPFWLFLSERYPEAWKNYTLPDHEGHPRRIIEAISEGVMFNPAEESIRADYVAAMRPKRTKVEKARAIERAFSYAGRPYDFDFDFYTDRALVCSELVFKSYEPRGDCEGLHLGLEKMVGRMTLGPNSIVKAFDEQLGTPDEQLTFAWFLDGREKDQRAAFADVDAFRATWKRPKWDIVQQ